MLKISQRGWMILSSIAVLAGLLYNSWPLGYVLNPVVASRGLASELEGLHEPYNWLFIALDVISSLLIMLVVGLIWFWHRHRDSWWLRLTAAMVFGFGIFTTIDALLPIRCSPSLMQCPSFRQDHLLLVHGIVSIAASICLFVSVAALWWHQRTSRLLDAIMIGYLAFGLFSLIALFTPGQGNWAQHYYITLCSIWLIVLPLALHDSLALASQKE
jgi:uncharacterized protein DUF998